MVLRGQLRGRVGCRRLICRRGPLAFKTPTGRFVATPQGNRIKMHRKHFAFPWDASGKASDFESLGDTSAARHTSVRTKSPTRTMANDCKGVRNMSRADNVRKDGWRYWT